MTDNPYSVILKRAKNTWTNGRVNVSLSDLRTVVLKFKRQYRPLFRDRGHIEVHYNAVPRQRPPKGESSVFQHV
jgi:hypothetical protein